MSDGNDTKTKEQLLAEIAALKEQLARREIVADTTALDSKAVAEGNTAEGKPTGAAAPVFAAPMTRRQSIVSWVAPVILSLPVVQAVGAVIKPGTAYAADDTLAPVPTIRPTAKPTPKPTLKPTVKPTLKPTVSPTATPTTGATLAPTRAGRCIIAPTAAPPTSAPSVSPTIGMASTPDSRPIADGFVPLGDARGLVRRDIGQ